MKRTLWRVGFFAACFAASASAQGTDAEREAAYAVSIARVADSAIRRLDFFPARAQLRVQLLFVGPRDSTAVLFAEISRRSLAAAMSVDEISSRFEQSKVPEDLGSLHGELVSSLHAARTALDHLSSSANACQVDPTSVLRCQTPFTSASSALSSAYDRYLKARGKIRDQVADTQTVLPEFIVASRGKP